VAVEIEQIPPPGVAVPNVRDTLHVEATEEERREQDARERKAATQRPVAAKDLAQSSLERRPRPQRPADDHRETDRCEDRQGEAGPEDWGRDATFDDRQRRRGDQKIEGDERQFVDQEAEHKAHAERARPARTRRRQSEPRARRQERRRNQITHRMGHRHQSCKPGGCHR